jgi:uncharacterized DUF497 family protein
MPDVHRVAQQELQVYIQYEQRMTCRLDGLTIGLVHIMQRIERLQLSAFGWNENKAKSNFEKHHITFEEAAVALAQPHLEQDSSRHGEMRVLAICLSSSRIIAVVYTMRGEICRIISARAARDYEKRAYRLVYPG